MCSYLLDAIDNISIANYQYNYIYFKKAVRIISMKLHYMSRFTYVLHLDISSLHLYFFLRTFFQKNIVVWIVIYSIGNGFVFDIVVVSRHWFHWRGRWLRFVVGMLGLRCCLALPVISIAVVYIAL